MNRAIHPTAIQQCPVVGIHDGVDVLQADISNKDVTMATQISFGLLRTTRGAAAHQLASLLQRMTPNHFVLKQYVEVASGEPASRRLVAAANLRVQ